MWEFQATAISKHYLRFIITSRKNIFKQLIRPTDQSVCSTLLVDLSIRELTAWSTLQAYTRTFIWHCLPGDWPACSESIPDDDKQLTDVRSSKSICPAKDDGGLTDHTSDWTLTGNCSRVHDWHSKTAKRYCVYIGSLMTSGKEDRDLTFVAQTLVQTAFGPKTGREYDQRKRRTSGEGLHIDDPQPRLEKKMTWYESWHYTRCGAAPFFPRRSITFAVISRRVVPPVRCQSRRGRHRPRHRPTASVLPSSSPPAAVRPLIK